jgi:osmotically-inducible protein OsmY
MILELSELTEGTVMKTSRVSIGARLCALSSVLAVTVVGGAASQDQGAGQRAGERIDEASRSIKRGLQEAGDAIRHQFSKVRDSVHNMGVESRVYGRLHWDKSLNSSVLQLEFSNGVVTLRGSVPDAKAKHKAVELAQDTVGVTKVIDQLAVQPPERTSTESRETAPPERPRP